MMLKNAFAVISTVLLAAMLALPANAQEVELQGDVKVVRTIEENGATHEELSAPERVLPGDRLVFTTNFQNPGTEPAEDFVVTNPLPGAVMLAQDGDFEVSVDGGATFGPLSSLKVGDGGAGERAAGLADVTHVRWTVARIEPGGKGKVEYFAVVR